MSNGDEVNYGDHEDCKVYHSGHGDDLDDHDDNLDGSDGDDNQGYAVAVCCNCEQMSRALRVS